MTTELPAGLTRYFAAQNAHDIDAMVTTFAPDAEVRDEGRTHVGLEAIRAWKLATSARYNVTAEALRSEQDGKTLKVTARVSGNFPGSPANLTYAFLLDDAGLIRQLEIG